MTSSVIPARLEFQCGHAALVSLPRIKGESSSQRNERVTREKAAAQVRACDFCGPDVAIVVQAEAPIVEESTEPVVETLSELLVENVLEAAIEEVLAEVVAEPEAFERVVFEELVVEPGTPEVVVEVEIAAEPVVEEIVAAARPRRVRTPKTVAQELRQFTVEYRVERVIDASDIVEALRRVNELGATNILAISRE